MDVTTLRIVATVVSFAVFLGIFAWAYWKPNGKKFEEAAQLPFTQD